ncbi:MAG: hypothetical protein ABIP10_06705 [Ferruginibacter sp.]
MTILISSCGSNPAATTEANNHFSDKSVGTVKQTTNSLQADTALLKTWSAFKQAISTNNIEQFREISLDSLYSCDTILSTANFIINCYKNVFDTTIIRKILIPSEMNQIDIEMQLGYFTKSTLSNADFKGDAITLRQFQILKQLTSDGAWTITFDFIKTKYGYKFFGCDSYGGLICCR